MPADVVAASERRWEQWKHDCSGFVHAVSTEVGASLTGSANAMVDRLNSNSSGWVKLGNNPAQARAYANRGFFVIAGLKEAGHGHVVIIVRDSGASHYPVGYWGRLGGIGRKNATINWAWKHSDLSKVEYFARPIP